MATLLVRTWYKGQLQWKFFVTLKYVSFSIHAIHKTTIFIIQTSVVFDLFVVEVVKHHFHLNFVTSQWVQAIIDFHLMKLALHYGVVCGKSQQSDYID